MSKEMTVRITFPGQHGGRERVLFGNSYKHWREQATEYIFRTYGNRTNGWKFADIEPIVSQITVEQSDSPWKSWGGLKWCEESEFQQELNREGVQRDDPDNPNPRQYDKFVFWPYTYGLKTLMRDLKRWS